MNGSPGTGALVLWQYRRAGGVTSPNCRRAGLSFCSAEPRGLAKRH